jgi:hypothetical protein
MELDHSTGRQKIEVTARSEVVSTSIDHERLTVIEGDFAVIVAMPRDHIQILFRDVNCVLDDELTHDLF